MRQTILTLLALLAMAAPAAAASDTRSETVPPVFMHGEDPADPGHCVAAVFAQWADRQGWVAQNFTTTFHAPNGTTREVSAALTPPFSDTFTFGAITWTAPAGSHQAEVSKTYRDGPGRSDCADFDVKNHALYPDPITLTFAITDACRTARDRLKVAKKAYKKAGRRKHKAAKAKLRRAKAAYAKAC